VNMYGREKGGEHILVGGRDHVRERISKHARAICCRGVSKLMGPDWGHNSSVLSHPTCCRGGRKMALGLISLIEFGADGGVFASGTGTTPLDEAKDPAVKHALLTALINRLDLNKTKAPEADTRAAFHCAAALGDVERLKALLNSQFLTSVDACDGLSRTALHWACHFSSMMAVDILLANGADPDLRASSKVDAIWAEEELSLWDSRLREPAKNDGTRGDYKKSATGQAIGPCGMDLLREKHHARVFARAVVDLALGRRDEESRDFVGVAARALAAEGRAAKEAQRLHEEGAAVPDKPIEELVKPGEVQRLLKTCSRPIARPDCVLKPIEETLCSRAL
jgi:hypothetical protein